MTVALSKIDTGGGHRMCSPEQTLQRISPHLRALGVSRIADITGLDRLGIPVYASMRPAGVVIQVSNGKGLKPVDAQVSAAMEAAELTHAETLPENFREHVWSLDQPPEGPRCIDPRTLPEFRQDTYFSPSMKIPWVEGEELHTQEPVWLPLSAVYHTQPSLFLWSSNGLASGNHVVEATLHALYELLERDALATLRRRGSSPFLAPIKVVNLASIRLPAIQWLTQKIEAAACRLQLIWVRSAVPVNTFWAVLLDENPSSWSTRVNIGYGTHWSAQSAAIRAITEAAQSRLCIIHASREDLRAKPAYHDPAFTQEVAERFARLEPTMVFRSAKDRSQPTLGADYQQLLGALWRNGYRTVYRAVLTRPPYNIPVVKLLLPGLAFDHRWI